MAIDKKSIENKAKQYMSTPEMKKRVSEKLDDYFLHRTGERKGVPTVADTAKLFIGVLQSAIRSSGLSANAINAISALDFAPPQKIAAGQYAVRVYFEDDLSRPSLDPQRYGGIDDLAELLNYGVDHVMGMVWGEWHGHITGSRTVIEGAYFMETAREIFMETYAKRHYVGDIIISLNEARGLFK